MMTACENGTCVAPVTCECYKEFSMSSYNQCEPVCEGSCVNGHCIAPGICSRMFSYHNNYDSDEDCNNNGGGNDDREYSGDSSKTKGFFEAEYRCDNRCLHGICQDDRCVCDGGCVLEQQEGKDTCVAIPHAGSAFLKLFRLYIILAVLSLSLALQL